MNSKDILRGLSIAALLLTPVTSFATGEDTVIKVKDRFGTIVATRGGQSFLGIGVADVDSERAKALRLREEYGVEVKSVEDDSPAAKAGLKEGDVVLEYHGDRVEGTAQFIRMVRETPAGRLVKLLISRDGSTQALSATIGTRKPHVLRYRKNLLEDDETPEPGEAPETPETPEPPEAAEAPEAYEFEMPEITIPEIHVPDLPHMSMYWGSPRLGIESESLGPQLAEFFGVKEGVLVRSVIKGSAAERAGLKAGDVITKVDSTKISSPGTISSTLRSVHRDKSFPITVVRSGKEMTLNVKLDEETKKGDGGFFRRAPRPRGISYGRRVIPS